MKYGFIKIHRKMCSWEWYSDSNTFRIFLHLLLKANHKNTRFRGVDVPAGSVIIGRKVLADELGLSEQQVRTSLNKLKSTNEITTKPTNKFSICTIVKWADYQPTSNQQSTNNQPTINQQVTNNQPTSNQQVTTSKECKNVKNVKNVKKQQRALAVRPVDVSEDVWDDFILLRKQKRAALTITALAGIKTQADKASLTLEQALSVACKRGWTAFEAAWYTKDKHKLSAAEQAIASRKERLNEGK